MRHTKQTSTNGLSFTSDSYGDDTTQGIAVARSDHGSQGTTRRGPSAAGSGAAGLLGSTRTIGDCSGRIEGGRSTVLKAPEESRYSAVNRSWAR
jgi:hypothetical protein